MPVAISVLTTGWLVASYPDLGFLAWGMGYAAGAWVNHRYDRMLKKG